MWKLSSLGYMGMRWGGVGGVSLNRNTREKGVSKESTGMHGGGGPRGYPRMRGEGIVAPSPGCPERYPRTPGLSPHREGGGNSGKGLQAYLPPGSPQRKGGTPPDSSGAAEVEGGRSPSRRFTVPPGTRLKPAGEAKGGRRERGGRMGGWRRRRGELNELLFFL